jgi:ribose transport system permease protein
VNKVSTDIKNSRITNFILRQRIIILLFALIILMFILGEIVSKGFLSYKHMCAILRTASFLGIVSMGQTIAILTGGIDLSVGALITMGNVFTCMFINGLNSNTLWALVVIVFIGAFFGFFNGFGVAYLKISPLVMTLAIGSLVTGITLIFSHGAPKGLVSPILRYIGVGSLLNLFPVIILVWIVLSAFFILLLNYSTFGRKIYYIGANEKAAFLSGIKTNLVKTLAYSISGASATFTGALMAGYTETAFLGIGDEYILWSIAAVVIGGTSLTGGSGGYLSTITGAIILVLLESMLTVLRIPEAGRRIANGAIILILISIYYSQKNKKYNL